MVLYDVCLGGSSEQFHRLTTIKWHLHSRVHTNLPARNSCSARISCDGDDHSCSDCSARSRSDLYSNGCICR